MTDAGLTPAACPCGRTEQRGKRVMTMALHVCCGRWLGIGQTAQPAPDAEALMRSRYTAFVLGHVDYLLATWHASTRTANVTLDAGDRWLGLQVRRHTLLDATRSEVEFVARVRDATGRAHRLHETSRFVCEHQQWFYVDGDLH